MSKIKEKRIILEEKTARLQFKKTKEAYKEALDSTNELKDKIYELEKIHNSLINTYRTIEMIKENLDQGLASLDDILYDINKLNREKGVTEEKIKAIEELLTDDINDVRKQMAECLKSLEELPKLRDKLRDRKVELRKDIESDMTKSVEIEEKVIFEGKASKILEENFKEELDLKYVIKDYEDAAKEATRILREYQNMKKMDIHLVTI